MSEEALKSAMQLHQAGQLDQAEPLYRKILESEPRNFDALHLLGVIAIQRNQNREAIDLILQAIGLRPDIPAFYSNLGRAFAQAGELDKAEICYRKLVELQPNNAAATDHLGKLLQKMGKIAEAIVAFTAAVRLKPEIAQYHLNLGSAYSQNGQFEKAASEFRENTRLEPKNARCWHNLAVALAQSDSQEEALKCFDKTIELDPSLAWAYSSKGITLVKLGRPEEALGFLRRAIEMDPKSAASYNNLGGLLQEQAKWKEALELYRKAVSLSPTSPTARWNISRVFLVLGEMKEGWSHFDARLELPHLGLKRPFPQPQWDGSDPSGKTILLHAEGGHGDAIQFIRLAPQIAERGAKLILECQAALVPLLERVSCLDRVVARGEAIPEFDWQIPLQSLPHVLGITLENIPNKVPYLSVPADRARRWKERLGGETKTRVGLVWSGSKYAGGDNRTRTIDFFAPLADVPGFKFYSLQKGPDSKQAPPTGMDWADYSAELNDFADTAALVENLDLVVTIDTSVAHLAGALARPVWVLIPFQCDFRWLLDRTDTPWYPTMRLFRQTTMGNWDVPIAELAAALRGFKQR